MIAVEKGERFKPCARFRQMPLECWPQAAAFSPSLSSSSRTVAIVASLAASGSPKATMTR